METEPKAESLTIDLTVEQLLAEREELQRRKLDAEKDRELFRDLYGKASSHVGEVTRENNELIDRVTVLEGKLNDGLALIRGTYEERIRRLEEDVTKWKGMYDVLLQRDKKMEGDEIRRKAALEPEVRAENLKLRDELEALSADYERMEKVLEQLGEQELNQLGEQEKALKGNVEHADTVEILKETVVH